MSHGTDGRPGQPPELDVDRLRVFVAVAHAGSIAAAARRLSFTPSALSQQLAKLEKELGAHLLERRPDGVVITSVGAVLLQHAERVLGDLREARAAVGAALERQPQHLVLGSFATAGQVLVPAALAALRRRHRGAGLALLDIEPPGGYGLVASGEVDVLITHRYPGMPSTPHAGLVRERLLDDPLLLALPADHPVVRGDSADATGSDPSAPPEAVALDAAPSSTPAEASALGEVSLARRGTQDWIAGAPGVPSRVCLDALARQEGRDLHVAYESADYHVVLALVAAGLGVALVPESVLRGAAPRGRGIAVRRLRDHAPAREICLVRHP